MVGSPPVRRSEEVQQGSSGLVGDDREGLVQGSDSVLVSGVMASDSSVSGGSEFQGAVSAVQRSVVDVSQVSVAAAGSVGFVAGQAPVQVVPAVVSGGSVGLSVLDPRVSGLELQVSAGLAQVSAVSGSQQISECCLEEVSAISEITKGLSEGFPSSEGCLASEGLFQGNTQGRQSEVAVVSVEKAGQSFPGISGVAVPEVLGSPSVEANTKSYLTAARTRPSLERHDMTLDEDQCFVVPEEIMSNSPPLWEDLLIGTFPETAPHIAKIHVIVNKIWTLGNKLVKIDAFVVNETTIKFRIRDKTTRERVLRRGMWNIANKPMMVSKYGPISEETQPALQKIPMWIELKHIPPSYFTWKGISYLASAVGEPKRLHPETELCKKFDEAKVFVEVDLTKPLKDSFRFKSQGGVISEVLYSYPWLPPRCRLCTKWGHMEKVCHRKIRPGKEVTLLTRSTQGQGNSVGLSEVSVATACASVTNVLASRKENQPKQALPHPVCEDTDEGGREAALSGALLVEETSTHTNNHLTEVDVVQLPATSHPAYGDADAGGVEEQRKQVTTNEEWTTISPKKSSRVGQVQETPQITVSPSRYSVLDGSSVTNDLVQDKSEQGKSLPMSVNGKSAAEDLNSRFPPPRVTRSYHRSAQNTTGLVNSSITGGKKKTNKN